MVILNIYHNIYYVLGIILSTEWGEVNNNQKKGEGCSHEHKYIGKDTQ